MIKRQEVENMAEIIPLARRIAWLRLVKFVKSGRIIAPKIELPKLDTPQSDMADALLYALKCKGD